jgi:hypothetical protein
MTLQPLVAGIAATALAVLQLVGWVALGCFFCRARDLHRQLVLPFCVLAGAALTAATIAVVAWFGAPQLGVAIAGASSLAAIWINRRGVGLLLRAVVAEYRSALRGNGVARLTGGFIAALLWIQAIAPPREADAMRYHLAHVRQILSDGAWRPIPDFTYALPFGWSINFMQFELVHLPQAAQLAGLGLLVVLFAGILRFARDHELLPASLLLCIALFAHPYVLKTFTSPTADAFAIFVVYAVCVGISSDESDTLGSLMLGFVSWIGLHSRYQLAAVGIAATIMFVSAHIGRDSFRRSAGAFAAGSVVALVLAAPFYLSNLDAFANPVWPLLVSASGPDASYADLVAQASSPARGGGFAPTSIEWALRRLFTTASLAPLPIVIVLLTIISLRAKDRSARLLSRFSAIFFVLWFVVQPTLYPRFIVYLLPATGLIAALLSARWITRRGGARLLHRCAAVATALFVAIASLASWDYVRYAATGDSAAFHRFTWYYPVYMWVNRATPPQSRILVIVSSGHSYYLDRPYRRADPWLSGVVDWRRVGTGPALDSVMRRGGYRFVIYDQRDWTRFVGGAQMTSAVSDAVARRLLVPVRSFRQPLFTSRFFRRADTTTVTVLERTGS